MFDFVWHLRGSVALKAFGPNEVVLDKVARLLERQRKPVTRRGSDYLLFDDPIWRNPFSPGWHAMGIYDRGAFRITGGIDGRVLIYDLRSLHGMVFCLVGACIFFLFASAVEGLLRGLSIGAFAFAWLYGMNVLLALARVPSAIRAALGAA